MRTDGRQHPVDEVERAEALPAEALGRTELGQGINDLRDRKWPSFVGAEGSDTVAQVETGGPQLGNVGRIEKERARASASPHTSLTLRAMLTR